MAKANKRLLSSARVRIDLHIAARWAVCDRSFQACTPAGVRAVAASSRTAWTAWMAWMTLHGQLGPLGRHCRVIQQTTTATITTNLHIAARWAVGPTMQKLLRTGARQNPKGAKSYRQCHRRPSISAVVLLGACRSRSCRTSRSLSLSSAVVC